MKFHGRLIILVAIPALLLLGCVSNQWNLFRLESLQPDSKGKYDFDQALYGTVDQINGWEVQLSIVSLPGGPWWRKQVITDKYGATVRMVCIDSLSRSTFSMDTLVITSVPNSVRFSLACAGHGIDSLNTHEWWFCFPSFWIPANIDTISADFRLMSSDDSGTVETTHSYHCRLVRFEKTFHDFFLFAY